MAKKNRARTDGIIDCACVIHGSGYSWTYVERLYNMLTRQLPQGIRFHVYTEHDRSVPPHMIKHCLMDWPGISGPKRSWWYKMQLFNSEHNQGNLLYFDLDCVIINNISWITQLSTDCFWCIRDFRYLQSPSHSGINSSVMWWNIEKFSHVWTDFEKLDIEQTVKKYHGDQDYIGAVIDHNQRRNFEKSQLQSWRWQIREGGYDFARRRSKNPGAPTIVGDETSILVFHGKPKPHECMADPVIAMHWQ